MQLMRVKLVNSRAMESLQSSVGMQVVVGKGDVRLMERTVCQASEQSGVIKSMISLLAQCF